ncbi:MAG: hypothetical protein JW940_12615 [Polyangiaceae bacterium]|nr:hypothetical protein [Polyangiaceae bacterium]
MLHGVCAALCLGAAWLAIACTDDVSVPTLSSTGGETATDAGALDAGEIKPATCVECSQAHQGDCHALAQQCIDDLHCRTILDCTFPSDTAGCGLDEAGAACTRDCIATRCGDTPSAELYLELEKCLYCDEECGSSCKSYCKALEPEKGVGECDVGAGGGGGAGGSGATWGGAGGFGAAGGGGAGVSGFGAVGGGASGAGGFGGVDDESGGAGTDLGGGPGASAGTAGSTGVAPTAGVSGSAGTSGE